MKTPKIYIITAVICALLFVTGLILLFVNLYVPLFPFFNSSVYIILSLCSLSLFVTDIVGWKEWRARHGMK